MWQFCNLVVEVERLRKEGDIGIKPRVTGLKNPSPNDWALGIIEEREDIWGLEGDVGPSAERLLYPDTTSEGIPLGSSFVKLTTPFSSFRFSAKRVNRGSRRGSENKAHTEFQTRLRKCLLQLCQLLAFVLRQCQTIPLSFQSHTID